MSRFAVGSTVPGLNTSGFSNTAGIQQTGRTSTNDRVFQALQQLQDIISRQEQTSLQQSRLALDDRNARSQDQLGRLAALLQGGQLSESIAARISGQELSRELGGRELDIGEDRLELDRSKAQSESALGNRELDIRELLGQGQLGINRFEALSGAERANRAQDLAEVLGQAGIAKDQIDMLLRAFGLVSANEQTNATLEQQERQNIRDNETRIRVAEIGQNIGASEGATTNASEFALGNLSTDEFVTVASAAQSDADKQIYSVGAEQRLLKLIREANKGSGIFQRSLGINEPGVGRKELEKIREEFFRLQPILTLEQQQKFAPLIQPKENIFTSRIPFGGVAPVIPTLAQFNLNTRTQVNPSIINSILGKSQPQTRSAVTPSIINSILGKSQPQTQSAVTPSQAAPRKKGLLPNNAGITPEEFLDRILDAFVQLNSFGTRKRGE